MRYKSGLAERLLPTQEWNMINEIFQTNFFSSSKAPTLVNQAFLPVKHFVAKVLFFLRCFLLKYLKCIQDLKLNENSILHAMIWRAPFSGEKKILVSDSVTQMVVLLEHNTTFSFSWFLFANIERKLSIESYLF